MRYEKYLTYDDKWIASLPAQWKYKRIKEVLMERKEKNSPIKTDNILSLTNTRGVIPYSEKGNIGNKAKENLEGYMLAYPNDIVLNSMNVIIGSVGLSKYFGAVSPVYYMLFIRNDGNIRFFDYVFRNRLFQESLKGLGNGILDIRMRIPMSKLNNVFIPIPTREEQDQIVRYLDWQVSKINKLIEAKKKQIDILYEREKKLIVSAILDKSEVDCSLIRTDRIKELLPTDWRVVSLGRLLTKIEQGWSPNAGEELDSSEQWHVLTLSAVKHGKYQNEAKKPIDINAEIPRYLELRNGDILLTRSNTRNLVGDVCVVENVEPQTIFSDLIYRLTINSVFAMPRYIMFYLLSSLSRYQIECAAKGSSGTMPKLAHSDIKQIRVILPPLDKQNTISLRIDELTKKTKICIDKIQCGIDTLIELRTRLISDVVTGQIDVRNIIIPDFELIDEIDTEEGSPDGEVEPSEVGEQ